MKEKGQTILIVEDNNLNRQLLREILSQEYEIIEAVNGKEAVKIILEKQEQISAILLDIVMPVMDGYEVLKYLKDKGIDQIPIIVMTGDANKSSEEKVLNLGAWDFVSKPYQPRVLQSRIKNAIARSQMSYLAKIRHIAEHDQLTNLYNRRYFFEVTEKLLKAHAGEPMAVIRLDINHFRLINSFWGEKGGDALLRFLAGEIHVMAETYSWCSYGHIESDVFCFCIPYEEAECMEKLNGLMAKIKDYNHEYEVESTAGVYVVKDDTLSAETMYMYATLAAEACKDKYMTFIGYYDVHMSDRMLQEQEITREMQHAVDNEEFQVYFQPKYNVQTKTPYGAEALCRWKHPEKGMISPGVFIPVFEANGFIGKLDYYMWEKTCQYLRRWIDLGISPAPISVNMSRVELTNPKLIEMLTGLTKKYQVSPDLLNLELTESAYTDNPEAISSILGKLHEAGFVVLMDDFGSGYSSLNILKDLSFDILKVDMKFLSLDENNVKSKKILTSVINMAQWIGIPVVTEGVETEEQYNFLQSIGCEYIQGYYFARPMPAEDYEKLISSTEAVEAAHNISADMEYMLPQSIKDKIYKDELTDVYNRRYLNEWLFLDIEGDEKNTVSMALILLDLKSFKMINDYEGHIIGDQILTQVAEVLKRSVRKNDAVIRYGGDEFILIFTNCEEAVVKKKIEELRKSIDKIALKAKYEFFQGANFGYAYTEAFRRSKEVLAEMIEAADRMMYQEKKSKGLNSSRKES